MDATQDGPMVGTEILTPVEADGGPAFGAGVDERPHGTAVVFERGPGRVLPRSHEPDERDVAGPTVGHRDDVPMRPVDVPPSLIVGPVPEPDRRIGPQTDRDLEGI